MTEDEVVAQAVEMASKWTCRANGSTWEVYNYVKGEPIIPVVEFWTFDDQYLSLPEHERWLAAYRDAKAEVDGRNNA